MRSSTRRSLLTQTAPALAAAGVATLASRAVHAQDGERFSEPRDMLAGQIAAVVITATVLESAGLEEMTRSLAAGRFRRGFLPVSRRARLLLAATPWPGDLAPAAMMLTQRFAVLQATLEGSDDVATAAEPAKMITEALDGFSDAVDDWLARIAGVTLVVPSRKAGADGDRRGRDVARGRGSLRGRAAGPRS